MAQQKYKFDKETLIKIGKGALIAGTGTAALYVLGALDKIDFGNAVTPIVGALVPILVNMVREWMKGEEVEIEE